MQITYSLQIITKNIDFVASAAFKNQAITQAVIFMYTNYLTSHFWKNQLKAPERLFLAVNIKYRKSQIILTKHRGMMTQRNSFLDLL